MLRYTPYRPKDNILEVPRQPIGREGEGERERRKGEDRGKEREEEERGN